LRHGPDQIGTLADNRPSLSRLQCVILGLALTDAAKTGAKTATKTGAKIGAKVAA